MVLFYDRGLCAIELDAIGVCATIHTRTKYSSSVKQRKASGGEHNNVSICGFMTVRANRDSAESGKRKGGGVILLTLQLRSVSVARTLNCLLLVSVRTICHMCCDGECSYSSLHQPDLGVWRHPFSHSSVTDSTSKCIHCYLRWLEPCLHSQNTAQLHTVYELS